jgi:hypothetical protein
MKSAADRPVFGSKNGRRVGDRVKVGSLLFVDTLPRSCNSSPRVSNRSEVCSAGRPRPPGIFGPASVHRSRRSSGPDGRRRGPPAGGGGLTARATLAGSFFSLLDKSPVLLYVGRQSGPFLGWTKPGAGAPTYYRTFLFALRRLNRSFLQPPPSPQLARTFAKVWMSRASCSYVVVALPQHYAFGTYDFGYQSHLASGLPLEPHAVNSTGLKRCCRWWR